MFERVAWAFLDEVEVRDAAQVRIDHPHQFVHGPALGPAGGLEQRRNVGAFGHGAPGFAIPEGFMLQNGRRVQPRVDGSARERVDQCSGLSCERHSLDEVTLLTEARER